jgi:hypothetical protein
MSFSLGNLQNIELYLNVFADESEQFDTLHIPEGF